MVQIWVLFGKGVQWRRGENKQSFLFSLLSFNEHNPHHGENQSRPHHHHNISNSARIIRIIADATVPCRSHATCFATKVVFFCVCMCMRVCCGVSTKFCAGFVVPGHACCSICRVLPGTAPGSVAQDVGQDVVAGGDGLRAVGPPVLAHDAQRRLAAQGTRQHAPTSSPFLRGCMGRHSGGSDPPLSWGVHLGGPKTKTGISPANSSQLHRMGWHGMAWCGVVMYETE